MWLHDPTRAPPGIRLRFAGGDLLNGHTARSAVYELACDPSAPEGAGPGAILEDTPQSGTYTVTPWRSQHACPHQARPPSAQLLSAQT